MRVHRSRLEKLIYSDAFRCSKCGHRVKRQHTWLRVNLQFILSRHTHCIRCGTSHVQRSSKRDRVDLPSKRFFSRFQHLLGAPLNKCVACRLQYYDWRPPLKREAPPSEPANQNTAR